MRYILIGQINHLRQYTTGATFNTLNTLHILNTKGEASSGEFSVAEPLLNDLKQIYHNRSTFSELLPLEHPIENCVCVCSGHILDKVAQSAGEVDGPG